MCIFFSLFISCAKVVKNGDLMENNSNAVFHGGVDGGHYFELIESNKDNFRFKIYMDYNQKLYIDGYFKKSDTCNLIFDELNIQNYISHYNNNVIYLIENKKGCRLRLYNLIYSW
ncbi:MAG: hypothetical protein WAT71_15895 [Ignavibacteria bacterium]